MARQPRIALVGQPHLLIQSTAGQAVAFRDDEDRRFYLEALSESARSAEVAVHGYALADHRVQLLATPATADALARFMQRLGRRYVVAFNRRHGTAGRLWNGRFGSAALLSEQFVLDALLSTEQLPVRDGCVAVAGEWCWSSARHHLGGQPNSAVSDPACYWRLGNTPFERQARYARLLESPVPDLRVREMESAVRGGWPLGSQEAIESAQSLLPDQALKPRARGRPKMTNQRVTN